MKSEGEDAPITRAGLASVRNPPTPFCKGSNEVLVPDRDKLAGKMLETPRVSCRGSGGVPHEYLYFPLLPLAGEGGQGDEGWGRAGWHPQEPKPLCAELSGDPKHFTYKR